MFVWAENQGYDESEWQFAFHPHAEGEPCHRRTCKFALTLDETLVKLTDDHGMELDEARDLLALQIGREVTASVYERHKAYAEGRSAQRL